MPFSKWINKLQPIQIMEYYSVLQFSAFIKTLFVQHFHRVFLDFPNHLHLIPLTTTPLSCWWYSYLSFLLVLRSLRSQHLGHLFGSHKAIVWPLWGVVSSTKWEVPRELLSATLTILLPNNGTELCGSVLVCDPWLKLYNWDGQFCVSIHEKKHLTFLIMKGRLLQGFVIIAIICDQLYFFFLLFIFLF